MIKKIFLAKVSLSQSSSISIFSSKEQEYEQRAQLLKRLAFVILCSEMDQYHKYMPEIQGKRLKFLKKIYFSKYRTLSYLINYLINRATC